ncbi:MAG: hypothetical protein ACREEM_40215 [Blastocatellia bacterium]
MKIGYCVEGSTDRGFVKGLADRWCPQAELIEGRFRGSTGLRLRAEIPKICIELSEKGCDVFLFLTDANTAAWKEVAKNQSKLVPARFKHCTLSGVADRNIESWLRTDKEWIARETGRSASDFDVEDPKGIFESALGITGRDKKETEIASLVSRAPLKNWIQHSKSFERFYRDARKLANSLKCSMPDELTQPGNK